MADDDEYIDLYADESESQIKDVTDSLDLFDDIVFEPTTKTDAENSKTQSESAIDNKQNITTKGEIIKRHLLDFVDEKKCIPVDGNEKNNIINVDINKETRENQKSFHIQEKPQDNIARKSFELYVGNLTWWTTSDEIIDAIRNIGVNDFKTVKFFEDRKNGKSKGFCCVSLSSEESTKLCMNVLPTIGIHEQNPEVRLATKHTLNYFESKFNNNGPIANNCSSDNQQSFYPLPNMQVPPPIYHGSRVMEQPPYHYQSRYAPIHHELPYHSGNQPINGYDMQQNEQIILSEEEHEELIAKNKTVSNLAISRAKADIKEKNYTSARDTLVTAISLIKKSRVAHDVRCKSIISSLEDTLHDIIRNSNRSRSSSRFNRRSTSRSRRRSRSKEHDRYRNRNSRRSKKRDYREFESRDSKRRRENEDEKNYSRKIEEYRKRKNERRDSDSEDGRYKKRK